VSQVRDPTAAVILGAMVLGFAAPGLLDVLGPALPGLLMGLMFMGCLDVRPGPVLETLRAPARVLALLATVHLLPALLAWTVASRFESELGAGLILAAATSSGFSVVFLSQLLGGRPGQALPLTVLSNGLTPVLIPLLVMGLAGAAVEVEAADMARGLALLVGAPLVTAAVIGRTSAGSWLRERGRPASMALLFALIAGVIAQVRDPLIDQPLESLAVGVVVAGLVAITFAVGWRLGRTRAERLTFGLVASYKNYTLATVVALEYLGPTAAIPAVVYVLVNNASLVLMRGKAPPTTPDTPPP
jgi:bile acid:Na+ symporter, BASS family